MDNNGTEADKECETETDPCEGTHTDSTEHSGVQAGDQSDRKSLWAQWFNFVKGDKSHKAKDDGKEHERSQETTQYSIENRYTSHDCYSFGNKKRGYMVIIANVTFNGTFDRKGAVKDLSNMKKVASMYGFKTISKTNVTQTETRSLLHRVSKLDHSDCDCFFFVISTHGAEVNHNGLKDHALLCSDGALIFTNDIIEEFNDTNCPSLKDKPKLFFIQACRGVGTDPGLDIPAQKTGQNHTYGSTTSADSRQGVDRADTKTGEDSWNKIPAVPVACGKDMLVMFAIPRGMKAWRSEADGSWMIYYLTKELMQLPTPTSLLLLLAKVNKSISQRQTNIVGDAENDKKVAVCVIEHKLTKNILFGPKESVLDSYVIKPVV